MREGQAATCPCFLTLQPPLPDERRIRHIPKNPQIPLKSSARKADVIDRTGSPGEIPGAQKKPVAWRRGLGKEPDMRRIIMTAVASCLLVANTGCILNMWSADDNIRMEQMLYTSEDLRQIREEWRRFWFTDMPSHLTPQRVHGGITP